MLHVVQHNFKQRFALNEAGTHIRAKQGHSIKVDPSKLLHQLRTEDIGDMIPTCALHSTYLSNVQSIMQRGLMPGCARGTSYRQHVHLAISDRPEAGLREGSDLILTVNLMRAQSAGCVFYISDNNVVLTADCIPPACIVSAKHTSTGAAFDLDPFRARYMKGSVMHAREFAARAAVHPLFASSVTSPRNPNSCDRCELEQTIAQLEALTSIPFCGVARLHPGQPRFTPDLKREWRPSCPLSLLALLRGKTLALKSALPAGTTMGQGTEDNEPRQGTRSARPQLRPTCISHA